MQIASGDELKPGRIEDVRSPLSMTKKERKDSQMERANAMAAELSAAFMSRYGKKNNGK